MKKSRIKNKKHYSKKTKKNKKNNRYIKKNKQLGGEPLEIPLVDLIRYKESMFSEKKKRNISSITYERINYDKLKDEIYPGEKNPHRLKAELKEEQGIDYVYLKITIELVEGGKPVIFYFHDYKGSTTFGRFLDIIGTKYEDTQWHKISDDITPAQFISVKEFAKYIFRFLEERGL